MQNTTEHPWHLRRVTHGHLHEHQNLLDLHLLTHAWSEQTSTPITNPFEQDSTLEDDTTPDDVLTRLEQAVLSTQVKTLREASTKDAASTVLEERSWKAGLECAQRRWPREDLSQITPLPRFDRRSLFVALQHSPLSWRLGPNAFLVRRTVPSEVVIELLSCPHERADSAELCHQHFQWLKGFFHHLHPAITPKIERAGSRCVVSW